MAPAKATRPSPAPMQQQSSAGTPPSWLTDGVMTKAGSENFAVASRFLPRATRRHVLAIYGFARLVDDLGDEVPGDRFAALAWLEGELDRVYGGEPIHPLMRRLVPTVRRFDIPRQPFQRLIEANRQDQTVTAYATFEDLVAYCELSANPVGQLVLYVLEAASAKRMTQSDAVCTGLQLVEHWQDVAEDLGRGRIYLPQEDLERFGCSRQDLAAPRAGTQVRRLMAFEVGRARDLLDRGAPLAPDLGGRAGLAVAGFVAGGRAALDAIGRAGYDVLSGPPRPTRARGTLAFLRTAAGLWLGGGRRAWA